MSTNNDNATKVTIPADAIKSCATTYDACRLVLQAHGPLHRSVLIATVRSTFPQFKSSSEEQIVHRAWSNAKSTKPNVTKIFAFHQRIYSLVSDAKKAADGYEQYRALRVKK